MTRGLINRTLKFLAENFFIERKILVQQPINGTIQITPKPYDRFCLVVPDWSQVNCFDYNVMFRYVPKNTSTMTLSMMFKNTGSLVTGATKVDVELLFFPIA